MPHSFKHMNTQPHAHKYKGRRDAAAGQHQTSPTLTKTRRKLARLSRFLLLSEARARLPPENREELAPDSVQFIT